MCLLTWCMVKFKYSAKCLRVCKLFLSLEMIHALEYTLQPNIQVSIPTLSMHDRLPCHEGLILCIAFTNVSKKFSSDGVSVWVWE